MYVQLYISGLGRRGRKISLDLSLFVFICILLVNFMIKLKFNQFLKFKTKINVLTVRIFYNLQNCQSLQSAERLANLVRGTECFVGLSILFVQCCSNAHLMVLSLMFDAGEGGVIIRRLLQIGSRIREMVLC